MDLRQIQYFNCLYEEGSVTRAAQRLNIVQPALSMQIARIESDIGQKLFERTSKGMIPTAAARTIYQLFLPIMRDLMNAQQHVSSLGGKITGHIAIGLVTSVTDSILAETLAEFAANYDDVEITINERYSGDLMTWLAAGNLDAAIINRPLEDAGLITHHILEEELVVVSGTAYGPKLPSTLRLRQLKGYRIALPSKRNGLRHIIDRQANQTGFQLRPRIEFDALKSITEFVGRSDWITILPAILVRRGYARAHYERIA